MTLFWRRLHSVNHGSSRLPAGLPIGWGENGEGKRTISVPPLILCMPFDQWHVFLHKDACLKLVCSAWQEKLESELKNFRRFCDILLHSECGFEWKLSTNLNQSDNGEIKFTRENVIKVNLLFVFTIKQKFSRVSCEGKLVLNYLASRKPVTTIF